MLLCWSCMTGISHVPHQSAFSSLPVLNSIWLSLDYFGLSCAPVFGAKARIPFACRIGVHSSVPIWGGKVWVLTHKWEWFGFFIFLLMTANTPDFSSSASWITLYPDWLSPVTDNESCFSPGTTYACTTIGQISPQLSLMYYVMRQLCVVLIIVALCVVWMSTTFCLTRVRFPSDLVSVDVAPASHINVSSNSGRDLVLTNALCVQRMIRFMVDSWIKNRLVSGCIPTFQFRLL